MSGPVQILPCFHRGRPIEEFVDAFVRYAIAVQHVVEYAIEFFRRASVMDAPWADAHDLFFAERRVPVRISRLLPAAGASPAPPCDVFRPQRILMVFESWKASGDAFGGFFRFWFSLESI
jgi:hypothetical protein